VQKIRYRLKDYFGNTIKPASSSSLLQSSHLAHSAFESWNKDVAATYTDEFVNDLITIRHENAQHPIIKETKKSDNGYYETHFTTQHEGNVLIESPYFEEAKSYELAFATDYAVQPSLDRSFVQIENSTLSSSSTLRIRVYMFDKEGNPLHNQIQPDNSNNAHASLL
jgi:hypothetical protein